MPESPPTIHSKRKYAQKIGLLLVEAGILDESQLDLALNELDRTDDYFSKLLDHLGFIEEGRLIRFLADQAGTPFTDLTQNFIPPDALEAIPHSVARSCRAVPTRVNKNRGVCIVAMLEPWNDAALNRLEAACGMDVMPTIALDYQVDEALYFHYEKRSSVQSIINTIVHKAASGQTDSEDWISDDSIIRIVERILARAQEAGASDIHIEPEENILRVRMRVDGILHQEILVPKDMQSAITARVKIIANLDLTESRAPQDGRATYEVGHKSIGLRVSTLPTCHGENIVLRLLDTSNLQLDLTTLGFSDADLKQFKTALRQPHGVILITGPTGSGKTTTLYSAMKSVCGMDRSAFTLEDPIEYRLPIIRQTQVNEEAGMTFAAGLRALLRQDPDIILVGETRDTETAQLMVRAALTGHLVFSTLHTNSAVESIPRLIDMGVEPYLLPAALNAVVAQRLARRICPDCRTEGEPVEIGMGNLGILPPEEAPERFDRGAGCSECNGTGYRGRVGLYEMLTIDQRFHTPILKGQGSEAILQLAKERGMRTLFQDGINKALRGDTTLEEIMRVAPPSPFDLT